MLNETVTSVEFSELAEARSKTYGFLSLIYLHNPNMEFLRKIHKPDFQSFLTALTVKNDVPREMKEGLKIVEEFVTKTKETPLKDLRKQLAIEHTRLFRGVKPFYGPPPPYESVYVEKNGRVMGDSTSKVSKKYAQANVSLPNQYKGEPPDYIGFELDFMRFLCSREASAWTTNNSNDAIGFLEMQRRFIREHLVRWIPKFCNKVIENAKIELYQGLARITKGFVRLDFDQIDAYLDLAKDLRS